MPTNEFKPFAIGDGANVLTPEDYAAFGPRQQGFQTGVLPPNHLNIVLRQSASIAAMIGGFTSDEAGVDVRDDGDLETLQEQFTAALASALSSQIIRFAADKSTTANTIAIDPIPPVEALENGDTFLVRVANTNTGPVTLRASGLDGRSVLKPTGADLSPGDITAGGLFLISFANATFTVLSGIGSLAPPSEASLLHAGRDVGTTDVVVVNDLAPRISGYTFGLTVAVFITATNSGPATINIGGLGAKEIARAVGGGLQPGDMANGGLSFLTYDGTRFRLINPLVTVTDDGGGGTVPPDIDAITGTLAAYWLTVKSATVATPPPTPDVGDLYLIPAGATGAWADKAHRIAQRTNAGWVYRSYPAQTLIGVTDSKRFLKRTDTGWAPLFLPTYDVTVGTILHLAQ